MKHDVLISFFPKLVAPAPRQYAEALIISEPRVRLAAEEAEVASWPLLLLRSQPLEPQVDFPHRLQERILRIGH